jgi:hypothetical protein
MTADLLWIITVHGAVMNHKLVQNLTNSRYIDTNEV